MPPLQGPLSPFPGSPPNPWPRNLASSPQPWGTITALSWVRIPLGQGMSPPLSSEGTLLVLPISLRLAKPGAMGVCFGDLPRLGALDDHCLLPSPRAFSLQGEPMGVGQFMGLLGAWGPGVRRGAQGSRLPLLPSGPLLLQRGAGPPGPALLLASNQFFLLWGPTAAPRSTATTAAATAAATTTVHRSHWAERSHVVTGSWRICPRSRPASLPPGFILQMEARGPWILTPVTALPCSRPFHSCHCCQDRGPAPRPGI